MPVRLSCPTCNTTFTLPELPGNGRAACPRCGDSFPIRSFTEVDPAEAEVPGPTAFTPTPKPSTSRGIWLVGIALLMGLLGFVVALWISRNQEVPKPIPQAPARPEGEVVPATQLEGLRYVPADADIVFAIQPGPVLAYAKRTNQDVRELVIKSGLPAKVFDGITNLGITLPQIDQIVGGANAAEMRFTLVLVLRQPPEDEEEFLRRLKAKKLPGNKPHQSAELFGLLLNVARVSPTVWAFGFDAEKDLQAVTRGGHDLGGRQFPAGLAEMIEHRVPPEAAVWMATDDGRWEDKNGVRLVLTLLKKGEWLPVLARGRAALAAVSLGTEPRLRVFVKAADEATGQRIRSYFAERAANGDKVQHGGGGELAFLDVPIDPATLFATLQQLLNDPGKK